MTSTSTTWKIVPFAAMSGQEVHDALRLRVDIFVVEQNCAYAEIDGKDPECHHVLGFNASGEMVATARIAPQGVLYPQVSVGRVVVRADVRGEGLGYKLMEEAMAFCKNHLYATSVKIAAQHHLEAFYNSLGFHTISEIFVWDGIDHVYMMWEA